MILFSRELFLIALLIVPGLACQPRQNQTTLAVTSFLWVTILGQREYKVSQLLNFVNE